MTIFNEAVRLFFALTALILVGMLSGPIGDSTAQDTGAQTVAKQESEIRPLSRNEKQALKALKLDRKASRKIIAKKG